MSSSQNIFDSIEPWRLYVEQSLKEYCQTITDLDKTRPPQILNNAMSHALMAGGKRLRPLLCIAVARAVDTTRTDAELLTLLRPSFLALELLHTYSLVHDDLPALDDDDLRRGQPTVHKAYDEATAILVGDALLTDSFHPLATAPFCAANQVIELASAAGSGGMVGGQFDDIQAEGKPANATSLDELLAIHRRKTGRLFGASATLGALAVNRPDLVEHARIYGHALGLSFQVQDDVLDVEGDVEKSGKVRGRDLKHDKLTTVRALGLDGAKQLARKGADEAIAAASVLTAGKGNPLLSALAMFAATRSH